MLVSIVIRTLNEEKHITELLQSINNQNSDKFTTETVIIDSGSTDSTLSIAKNFGCRITHITKDEFTFGRSLNMGSLFANGEILVYVSGHCIPLNNNWLENLVKPILDKNADYTYGRQVGRDTTKYSEFKIFEKYFPDKSKKSQNGFFCNNANSAISRDIWMKYKFDEEVTGLEDMELAKRLFEDQGNISYVSDATVFHIHNENFTQTRRRYERESIALQKIMPEVQIGFLDMLRYILVSIISDSKSAINDKCFFRQFFSIVFFRVAQYTGSYRGNHQHRELSRKRKEDYFYPSKIYKE